MAKTILSGIQTSGDLHIGNYLGAIKQWVEFQNKISPDDTFLFMLADLHAITVPHDPETLRKNVQELVVWFLASGLDPKKVSIFSQADNPDHPYMAWIFNCITPMGWLERMTQFKDKSTAGSERASVGLFAYPNLMAADILLYQADEVPVGDDQKQHVELTTDIVERFNKKYGEVFKLPKFVTQKTFTRIGSLQDPHKKMSKSDPNQSGVIRLSDGADVIADKIRRAVTDSESSVSYDPDKKPAISNLMAIYTGVTGDSMESLQSKYMGKQYSDFKNDLAEVVVNFVIPLQKRRDELFGDMEYVHSVLDTGANEARLISNNTVKEVRKVLGLDRHS